MNAKERLEAAKERRRNRVWRAVVGTIGLFVVIFAVHFFLHAGYWTVGRVYVEGNDQLSQAELYEIANIPDVVNVFALDTTDVQKRLRQDLRIEDVEVQRKFPAILMIRLKERRSIAYVANQYGYVQIDLAGYVLAEHKAIHIMNLPMITGVNLGNVYIGDQIADTTIKNMLTYLKELDAETLNQISEINIKNPDSIIVYTNQFLMIRIGSCERLVDKAHWTNNILQEIRIKKLNNVEYVDLHSASPVVRFNKK